METLFLILTLLAGGAEGALLLYGYALDRTGKRESKTLKRWKFGLFCGFFVKLFAQLMTQLIVIADGGQISA